MYKNIFECVASFPICYNAILMSNLLDTIVWCCLCLLYAGNMLKLYVIDE